MRRWEPLISSSFHSGFRKDVCATKPFSTSVIIRLTHPGNQRGIYIGGQSMNKGARHTWYVTRRFAVVVTLALFFTSVAGVLAAPIITVTKTATLLIEN